MAVGFIMGLELCGSLRPKRHWCSVTCCKKIFLAPSGFNNFFRNGKASILLVRGCSRVTSPPRRNCVDIIETIHRSWNSCFLRS